MFFDEKSSWCKKCSRVEHLAVHIFVRDVWPQARLVSYLVRARPPLRDFPGESIKPGKRTFNLFI